MGDDEDVLVNSQIDEGSRHKRKYHKIWANSNQNMPVNAEKILKVVVLLPMCSPVRESGNILVSTPTQSHLSRFQREGERGEIQRESNMPLPQKELSRREVKDEQVLNHKCPLQVVLPPERKSSIHVPFRQPRKRNSHVDDTECNVVLEDETRRERVFTLYHFDNSGKVTKQDMCSLMQSIYEVVEASAKQPSCSSTALKVKLVVGASSSSGRGSRTGDRMAVQQEEAGSPERVFHCVDENTERRNHYLDLAGIENYSSKFDDADAPSQDPRVDARSDQQHRSELVGENCASTESRGRGLSFIRSLRGHVKAVGGDRGGGGGGGGGRGGKSGKLHGHQPSMWCHPSQPHSHPQLPLQHSQSKRLRSRAREAGSPSRTLHHLHQQGSQAQPGGEREMLPSLPASSGGLVPLAQRHEHHHEHHHHHHHHYHPPA